MPKMHSAFSKIVSSRTNQNLHGFSLVEMMVVVVIISFIGLASATMIVTQNKEVKGLTEKLLAVEMETQLGNVFIKNAYCNCLFQGKTFNSSSASAFGFNQPLGAIPDGYTDIPAPCTRAPSDLVPAIGERIGNRHVKILSTEMTDFTPQGNGYYTANILVKFDPETLVRELRPITTPIAFQVDEGAGTATARPFLACSGSSSGISSSVRVEGPETNGLSTETCPVGYRLTQCHAQIISDDGNSLMYMQAITYNTNSAGDVVGCTSNMTDSEDTYRLQLLCLK